MALLSVKENKQHGMPANKGDAENVLKNIALALPRLHGNGQMKHCVCESGMALTALAEAPHRLRCTECGSIWYRTDPKARARQGAAGARKRWKAEARRAREEKALGTKTNRQASGP